MKTFKVTDAQHATLVAALLRYSLYWQDKADRGTEGRAGCQANADEASSLYHWLSGMDVDLPIVAPQSQPAAKSASANRPQGGATIPRKPVPPAPPSGDKLAPSFIDREMERRKAIIAEAIKANVNPRTGRPFQTEQADIEF